jgi:DNA helicase-2/ATP-dependent DNA helicase PcrA
MDEIIKLKKQYKSKISIYQTKILKLENEIINIDKQMANFSDMDILQTLKLSDQQREIVESKNKNILVVACPGSGKTHTLISRFIHLVVKEKIDPDDIILITFTKKAGMEMNERINNIIPNKQPHYVGSLHGLGYRLLQQNSKSSYTVIDDVDSHKLLRECMNFILAQENFDEDENSLISKNIIYIYDKISTCYPINVDETLKMLNINLKYKKVINKGLREYAKTKKKQNLYDFNDLMIQFCEYLDNGKFDSFINKIKYIFFDEYQDVNMIQNYILNKFKNKSNLMVVGDDAQAIYSFRGSSVQYIWDFEKTVDDTKTYYLETNYRSSSSVVNFCQDIINNNDKQFKKNVVSFKNDIGLKPQICCYNSQMEQYKFIAQDIINKNKNGISLKDMVILARKNSSLDAIEMELLKYKIPIIKSIGVSLLNKNHIKDFFAFLTVIVNPKSLIHWKRILALHKNIGMEKAKYIIEKNNNNILKGIKELIDTEEFYKNNILNLYELFDEINKTPVLNKKISLIQDYICYLYTIKKIQKLEDKLNDIKSILTYFNDTSIEDYINNIYLNCDMEVNMEETLFLSTAHGSKGLEWEYVYLIDMTSKDFPNIRQDFYKFESNNCEEERRLFYVAASRAKKYLTISYYKDNNPSYTVFKSPFVNELNKKLYLQHNIMDDEKYGYTGIISKDVTNYLRFKGYNKLSKIFNNLEHTRKNLLTKNMYLPISNNLRYMFIIGNFMDYLIIKIIHNHFHEKCYKFDLPLNNQYPKFPSTLYHNYKDHLLDWRDMLEDIYLISTYKVKNKQIIEEYNDMLINDEMIEYYNILEKSIIKMIKNKSPKRIFTHFNLNHHPLRGEADIILDDTIIEMKCSTGDACTFSNLCQVLMYSYLANKKTLPSKIRNVSIFNSFDGTYDEINIKNINLEKIKDTIYS